MAEKTCFKCSQKGHIASICPNGAAAASPAQPSTASATKASKTTATFQTPQRKNGSILRRDSELKRCKVCCFVGMQGDLSPTLAVQVKLDSYSDCNLIPEQWLVALRGEGVEVPLDL